MVSVIIPTYNRCALLKEAIASVQSQTYKDWELIIIDDGSTDDTVEEISKISDQHINIVSMTHVGLLGILRNAGVANSKGEWVAFLDSDDLWMPRKLELQLMAVKGRRWVYGCSELIDENRNAIPAKTKISTIAPGWIVPEILNTTVDFSISSLMVEKNYFEQLGGFSTDPRLFCREDHEFTLRLALHAEAAAVPEIVVQVREHRERTTNVLSDAHERSAAVYSTFAGCDVEKKFHNYARRKYSYHLSEASVENFRDGHPGKAVKYLAYSLWQGDNMRHWLSSIKRGIYAAGKRYF
jgi:glycosyltransferase involved in cell wall biosynthesis